MSIAFAVAVLLIVAALLILLVLFAYSVGDALAVAVGTVGGIALVLITLHVAHPLGLGVLTS